MPFFSGGRISGTLFRSLYQAANCVTIPISLQFAGRIKLQQSASRALKN